MSYDHNDIYNIVERLAILEGRITPDNVKHGLNKQQKSVPQLPALFKPKHISVLGAKKDPEHPMHGYMVGDSVEDDRKPVEEAVATEDVLDKVKKSFADYLSNVADEIKQDTDLKDKKREDTDLKHKDKRDRDLISKVVKNELDEDKLSVGDPIIVTAPNEFEGATGEIAEFSPSGKFVVVNLYNHGEHSMHLSNVEYNQYADDEDVDDAWTDDEPMEIPVKEDPTQDDETTEAPPAPVENPVMPESVAVKTVTNECGLWEIHGNEPEGFVIHFDKRPMKSRFKTIDEAVMALEMFAARRKANDDAQDYIEEA